MSDTAWTLEDAATSDEETMTDVTDSSFASSESTDSIVTSDDENIDDDAEWVPPVPMAPRAKRPAGTWAVNLLDITDFECSDSDF